MVTEKQAAKLQYSSLLDESPSNKPLLTLLIYYWVYHIGVILTNLAIVWGPTLFN